MDLAERHVVITGAAGGLGPAVVERMLAAGAETSRRTPRPAASPFMTSTGPASVSTASGDAVIGDLDGEVKFRAASGSLTVRRLHGNVNAQTASGDVAVATGVNGGVSVQTSSGELVVGVAEGTAAQLDLRTGSGEVRNLLTPSDGPAEGDETLVVHARTGSGNVVVQRATAEAMS